MSTKSKIKDLKQPDVFVSTSDHLFNFIHHHRKSFGAAIGVVLVVALAWVAYDAWDTSQEKAASQALYTAEASLKKLQTGSFTFATLKPQVEALKKQIQTYSGTRAALVSSMSLVQMLLQQKQPAVALEVMDLVSKQASQRSAKSGDAILGLFKLAYGLVLAENNQLDRAKQAYQEILDNKDLKIFQAEARLKMGLLQQQKGDMKAARENLEAVRRENPGSEAAELSLQYLRLLKMRETNLHGS